MIDKNSPIFIIGYKRSGTTLLRKVLNTHADISIPTESEYFQKIPSIKFDSVEDLSTKVANLTRCDFGSNWSAEDIHSTLVQLNAWHPKDVIASLYIKKGIEDGKVNFRWGDKKPQHWKYVKTLLNWYPNAQFIHITRNPYDVIASIENWMPDQVIGRNIISSHIISAWQWNYSENYVRDVFRTVPESQYTQIMYEELVTSPQDTFEKLMEFLDLDFDKNILDAYLKDKTDINNHNIESAREINNENIGKGLNRFSKKQKLEIALLSRHKQGEDINCNIFCLFTKVKTAVIRFLLNIAWKIRRFIEKTQSKI